MKRNTWLALAAAVVVCAGSAGGYWYWLNRRPEAERIVVDMLRKTKKLAMDTKLKRGNYYDETIKADVRKVADSFKIIPSDELVTTKSNVSVAVYDLEAEFQLILWLYPPDVVNFESNFYRIQPGFWKELLNSAPKTVEFLKKNSPNALGE